VLVVNLTYKQLSLDDNLSKGRRKTMAFGNPVKPKNQPARAKKVANQGGAGNSKAVTAPPILTGTPSGGKPKASVTMLTKQPSGTRGSK
jgi:hypothetical protein